MATFAILDGNIVSNTIIADTKEIAELVTNKPCAEYTENNPASIGYIYSNGVFTAPETPAE